jgi:hypothetical protein
VHPVKSGVTISLATMLDVVCRPSFFKPRRLGNRLYFHHRLRSRDSVVGIATGYGLDDRGVGVRAPVGSRIFSTSSRPALGSIQPPIQWVPGAVSPGVRRPWRESDHSPPASAEVKKTWVYTSTLLYAIME